MIISQTRCYFTGCYKCLYVILFICTIVIIFADCLFHELFDNLINFGILIVSLFALILAYKTRNDWMKNLYKDKELNAKNDLIVSIIDMMATLDINSWDSLPMSEKTEDNPEIAREITIDKKIMHQELLNIDVEFTRKMRIVNKNYKIYEYYSANNDSGVIEEFLQELRNYRNKIYGFVWLKLRFYLDEDPNDFEKFENKRPEIETLRNSMNEKFETFKNKLKSTHQ